MHTARAGRAVTASALAILIVTSDAQGTEEKDCIDAEGVAGSNTQEELDAACPNQDWCVSYVNGVVRNWLRLPVVGGWVSVMQKDLDPTPSIDILASWWPLDGSDVKICSKIVEEEEEEPVDDAQADTPWWCYTCDSTFLIGTPGVYSGGSDWAGTRTSEKVILCVGDICSE